MIRSALAPIDPQNARHWRAWASGPRTLELKCLGGPLARAITLVHLRWPFERGHTRLNATVGRLGALRDTRFVTSSGVILHLDVGAPEFLHLSGRLPTEPLELSLLSRLVRPGDLFVDVGAHWGLYIAHVLGRLEPGGRYHAFEPSPVHAPILRRIFRDTSSLEVHECALSDVNGRGVLTGLERTEAKLDDLSDAASGADVRVQRLDEVFAEASLDGHCVMKIDVEGHEARVLRGSQRLFAHGLRPTVMLEFLPKLPTEVKNDLIRTMKQYLGKAYYWYAICQTHGTLHGYSDGLQQREEHEVWNLLLVPTEQLRRVQEAFTCRIEPAPAPC